MATEIYHRYGLLSAMCLVVLLAWPMHADPRRRAIVPSPLEPAAEWLAEHAIPLETTEPTGNNDDLAPLAAIVGDAHVVALGDGTFGTHEFFTTKLRMLQFLVERMGFDVLVMAGSY